MSVADYRRYLESEGQDALTFDKDPKVAGATREIADIIRNKIVWGVYGRSGLIKLEEYRDIEVITPEDWELFQKLYLKGLYTFPWAFGAKYEDQEKKTEEEVREFLETSTVFGVKHTGYNDDGTKEKLVGMAEFAREGGVRDHVAWLGKVFVHPAHWNHDIGEQLTYKTLDHAMAEGVEQVNLVVTSTNSFKKFYDKLGFVCTRTEYKAAKVWDALTSSYQWYDWDYMTLDMDDYKKSSLQQEPDDTK